MVILTDSQYAIADRKAKTMQRIVESCMTCSVLDYVDSPMAESSTRMPQLVVSLKQHFGSKLDWILAVRSGISRPTTGRETVSIPTTGIVINTSLFDPDESKRYLSSFASRSAPGSYLSTSITT